MVAVSGRSVRVTVACSAGLAAELPVWGLQLRGDAEWAVRAFRPVRVRVLREGERALLQAELQDADGRGVPSAARLQRAMLLATPALDAAQLLGVEVQREGASDPSQHGRTAPLLLPKKELGRFLQRIKDAEKLNRERAAALLAKEASKVRGRVRVQARVRARVRVKAGARRMALA